MNRFYADTGLVPPTTHSPAGYRLYDNDALVRLQLVRTLRELGIDLPTIRQVLEHKLSGPDVAAARLDVAGDPRAEQYWQLLAVINGWPVPPSLAPVIGWFSTALRAM